MSQSRLRRQLQSSSSRLALHRAWSAFNEAQLEAIRQHMSVELTNQPRPTTLGPPTADARAAPRRGGGAGCGAATEAAAR
jgi:hypothetical protein